MIMMMELLQKPFPDSLKRYWKRRQYQRLDDEVVINGRRKVKVVRIGGGRISRRFWKVKAIPKLSSSTSRVAAASPLKLVLTKLKDGYINMMIGLGGNVESKFGEKRIPKARKPPLVYSNYVFDQRLIYEICKALNPTQELSSSP